MIVKYTCYEGSRWYSINLKRKTLNKLLKKLCYDEDILAHGFAAIKVNNIIYDSKLFKYLNTYFRKEIK